MWDAHWLVGEREKELQPPFSYRGALSSHDDGLLISGSLPSKRAAEPKPQVFGPVRPFAYPAWSFLPVIAYWRTNATGSGPAPTLRVSVRVSPSTAQLNSRAWSTTKASLSCGTKLTTFLGRMM